MEDVNQKNICPLCEKHCDLTAPHCKRGAAYRADTLSGGDEVGEHGHHSALSKTEKLMRLFHHCSISLGRRHHAHEGGPIFQGQHRILGVLAHFDKISQRDLIQETRLRPASLGELLQKIEKNGYIVREQDQNDRRNMIISLTESGKEAVALAKQEHKTQADRLFSVLTEEEQQTLAVLLQRLADAWETEADNLPEGGPHHHPHGPHGHGFGCGKHHGPAGCHDHLPEEGPHHHLHGHGFGPGNHHGPGRI